MPVQPDIFWSNEAEKNSELSFVPGVDLRNRSGNLKPNRRVSHPIPKKETRPKNFTRPTSESKHQHSSKAKPEKRNTNEEQSTKLASLRDLCPEDKERIANLVKELAKAAEEKQQSEVKLGEERKKFQQQLSDLREEKNKIEKEQISVLNQYQKCQKLLTHYQEKITDQQKEVAADINKLLTTAPMVASGPMQANQSLRRPSFYDEHDVINRDLTMGEAGPSTRESQMYSSRRFEKSPLPYNKPISTPPHQDLHHVRKLSYDKTPQKESHSTSYTPKFTQPTESSHEPMSVNQSSYNANHVNTSLRRSSPPVMEDTEAYIQSMKSAFQTKMGGLSPRGRREALMQQKLALEREQIHLQQMLREQEEILRLRQSELKKRHSDYTNKLQSFNCTGANATPSETYDESTDVYSTMNDYPRTITPVLPKYSRKLNSSSYCMSEYDRSRDANHVRDRDQLSSFVSSKYSPNDESSSRMNRCSQTPVRSPLRPKSNISFRNSLQHSMHDSQINTDDSLSRSQATMNNISMLSELIDTVDLSPPSGHMSQYTRSQADRDDLLTSTTFDPEDSELLDDIFFIR